jgi:hypothetical protein
VENVSAGWWSAPLLLTNLTVVIIAASPLVCALVRVQSEPIYSY